MKCSVKAELEQCNKRLMRQLKIQKILIEFSNHISGIFSTRKLIRCFVPLVRDKLGWSNFIVFWLNKSRHNNLEFLSVAATSGIFHAKKIEKLIIKLNEGIAGKVAKNGIPILVNNLAKETSISLIDFADNNNTVVINTNTGSILSIPMIYRSQVVGVIDFYSPKNEAFKNEDINLFSLLGSQFAIAKVNAEVFEEILILTISDPLTGVMNRRAMEHQIFNEIIKSKHYLNPFALLMIDADHFKNFNDRMGHIMGDIALKDISVRLKSLLKREDSIARFGGEEFCIMLPKTNEIKALSVAEKLCSIIRASKIVGALSQPLGYFSVSIGIAIYPYDIALLNNNSLNELIYVADAALYAAKRAGRNRAVLFSKI